MTIRRTLLFSFLIASLLPTAVLTFFAFVQARSVLEREIARNLLAQASTAMTQIDVMLFERMENVRTWTQLEVMQDLRIGDIDKRVSRVLTDLKAGHEVYPQIFCATPTDSRIIAASDPTILGQRLDTPPPWLTVAFSGEQITLDPLLLSSPTSLAHLRIHAAIADAFQAGSQLGTLYAVFDWEQIFRILDQVEQDEESASKGRMAVLLDRDGRIIAASALLRQRGLLLSAGLATWPPTQQHQRGVMTVVGQPLGTSEVLVGHAPSQGYQHFQGFGWSTVVVQSTPQAFLPIQQMGFSFLLLLTLTAVLATVASLVIAARLAHPILRLADFTRHFVTRGASIDPPIPGTGEMGELTSAFIQMIQDLEQSREDLVRAAKLAVVGEMAAAMAHEVRTPLGILRSSAQMLQRESRLSAEGREMASYVVSETDRLNRLVSTLLDLARPRSPMFRVEDVHAIIQRAVELLAQRATGKKIHIRQTLDAASPLLSCDKEQMMQVFLNLLLNALQVLPPGGEITIATRMESEQLIVEMTDNGPGIPAEHRRRVFDSFFTTREDGIGLGLAIVQQIVRAHGGEIAVSDSAQGGACFRLLLPRARNGEV